MRIGCFSVIVWLIILGSAYGVFGIGGLVVAGILGFLLTFP